MHGRYSQSSRDSHSHERAIIGLASKFIHQGSIPKGMLLATSYIKTKIGDISFLINSYGLSQSLATSSGYGDGVARKGDPVYNLLSQIYRNPYEFLTRT
jgi:hypothetical protein